MNCDDVVETTVEAFSISFTEPELAQVRDVLAHLTRPGEGQAIIWLVDRGTGTRLWIFEDAGTIVWVRTEGHSDGTCAVVPIEPVLLMEMGSLALEHDTVTLSLVPEDSTLVAAAGGLHICVDHLVEAQLDEETLVATAQPEHPHASANVALSTIASAVSVLRVNGAQMDGEGIPPFVGMKIAGGEVRFTVDWRRFGGGRYTGAFAATHEGEATVSFFGHQLVRFLQSRRWDIEDSDASVRLSVEHQHGVDTDLVRVTGTCWGVAAWADRESAVRWNSRVADALTEAGCDVVGSPRFTNSISFHRHGIEMTALIEPGDGPDQDRVRLLVQLGAGITDNLEVHREINAFNREWPEVKIVLSAPNLFGVIDVPCEHLDRLGSAVETLASRHIDLAPMLNVYC